MKILCNIISLFAIILFRKDWVSLKRKILLLYEENSSSNNFKCPKILKEMLIIAEDRRFLKHNGIDFVSIIRAVYKFVFFGKIEGGSTIEQQLIRIITRNRKLSLSRKIKEIFLSTLIHKVLSKDEVIELYLLLAYFGPNMNGILQACKYLGIDINSITPFQSAELIARLKYPGGKVISSERRVKLEKRINFILKKYYEHSQRSSKVEVNHYETY